MTGREKKLLALGTVGGALLGVVLFFLVDLLPDGKRARHVGPAESEFTSAPASAPGASQRAVQTPPAQPGALPPTVPYTAVSDRR